MKFNLKRPCADCPFRTDRRFYLRADRVREILGDPDARGIQWFPADSFACHKTLNRFGRVHDASQHCAGAAIILIRDGIPNTAMQLAERLLGWDARRLDQRAPVDASRRQCIERHR